MKHSNNTAEQLAEQLDNEARLFAPCSPLHPLWDDVRREWMRDFQIA